MTAFRNRFAAAVCVAVACCVGLSSCGTTSSAPISTSDPSATTQEQSFEFGGMTFTLPGQVARRQEPACASSWAGIASGTTAVVQVQRSAHPNCPLEAYLPIPSRLSNSLLGFVTLRSGVAPSSSVVVQSKAGALQLPLLPAGSFEARLGPELAGTARGDGPTIIVWNSRTHALIQISGPRSTELAADVVANLHS